MSYFLTFMNIGVKIWVVKTLEKRRVVRIAPTVNGKMDIFFIFSGVFKFLRFLTVCEAALFCNFRRVHIFKKIICYFFVQT